MATAPELASVQINLKITIKTDRARVWKGLIEEVGSWWLKDFYATKNPKGFYIEPRLGGRMYEDAADGAGILWYTVIGIDPGYSISLAGHLAPPFGGPATTLLRLSLEGTGKNTLLNVVDSVFGCLHAQSEKSIREGWQMLFEDGLKSYLEK